MQVRQQQVARVSGLDMADLPVINDAFLLMKEGKISDFGVMSECPELDGVEKIDATGKFVFPSFVDSHTHIVFAASRESEFVDKIKGASYEEIARKGGGILNSAKKLQAASEEELFSQAQRRVNDVIGTGTGAIEIKSGYGLTLDDELKMLRVAKRIGLEMPVAVKTTFLGAHAIPKEVNREDYIRSVIEEMIPAVAEENLATYCDVFCEEGFFNMDETERIVEAGKQYGLTPKIHANQLNLSGGVQVGVKTGAISVDHLECVSDTEIGLLQGSDTMPTALPGAAFYLRAGYPPAREMINKGLPLAIATDYNPGSAPSGNMLFMLSLACIQMRLTPEEAINAATINTAYAMDLTDTHGSITKGKVANVFITKEVPSIAYLPYSFSSNLIDTVILNGSVYLA